MRRNALVIYTQMRRVRLRTLLLLYWRFLNFELHILHAALSRKALSARSLAFIGYLYAGVLMWAVYWILFVLMTVVFVISIPFHGVRLTIADRTT